MAHDKIDPKSPIPRYYQLYTSLRSRIRDGVVKAGDALPSERQLVDRYGISRITVVKALDILENEGLIERQHGRGNFVSTPLTTLDEPSRLKIAFLFPYVYDHQHIINGLLKGIQGQEVQFQFVLSYNPSKEPWYVQDAINQGFDGFVFYPVRGFQNEELYTTLLEKNIPFVMVDRYHPSINADHVIFDDYCAGYELTEFLIKMGHKKMAMVTSHEVSVTSVQERLRGYRHALEDHNLNYDEELVWLDIYRALDGHPASIKHLKTAYQGLQNRIEQHHPGVLIAINWLVEEQIVHDVMAIREGCSDFKIDVATFMDHYPCPKDDFMVAGAVQSGEKLGETAIKLLIDRINGKIDEPLVSKKIPMEIVDLRPNQQKSELVSRNI